MHDVLAHRISLVSMHAGALELRLESSADEEVVRSAETIRRSAHAALEDLRDILGVLREQSTGASTTRNPRWPTCPPSSPRSSPREPPSRRSRLTVPIGGGSEALGRTAFRVVQEG